MTHPSPDGDGFTELVDPSVPRVDLVDLPANGASGFLLMKQDAQAGLMPPDAIRALIGKAAAEPVPAPRQEDAVTVKGSPAAIAKLIHEASVRRRAEDLTYEQLVKAKYNAEDLRHMASTGAAMDNESYPIADREDLDRAIRAVGRGGASHDAIRRHIIHRAKALGASSEIPDNWNKDGSLKGDVAKEMDMDDDALDATVALAEPDGDYAGMDTDPGSPAWEAIDAASARHWLAILARAKNAIDMLAEREMLEAAAGDEDDAMKAFDLQDACCAIDYAISILAPFAVSEQAEADCGDDMQMVGKALHAFDAAQLDTIEALAPVAKAGRVLSAANEAAIRQAADSLQKVLASLPQAPTTDEGDRAVAKTANEEPNMDKPTLSEDVTASAGQESAMGSQQPEPKAVAGEPVTEMTKADGEKKMVAVYDKRGNLVGIVDPEKITMIEGAEADDEPEPTSDDTPDAADDGEDAPETPDLTPEPPAEAGTPADAVPADDEAVTKSTNDTTDLSEMFKGSVLAAVEDALTKHSTNQTEQIAKQSDAVVELVDLVKALQDRVGVLEEQPAMPKVLSNGVQPPRDLRGMDRGTAAVDVTKAQELKKSLMASTDAVEQRDIAKQMQERARAAFDLLQPRG